MADWISKETLLWVSTASGIGLLILAIVIPWLIVKMPRILKNILAIALLVVGSIMFLTPASGLFPILLGVVLADFPGKHKLERWILCRDSIRNSMNWLRRKFRRKPVEMPSRRLAA